MTVPLFANVLKHIATCREFQGTPERIYYAYGRVLRRVRWNLPARQSTVQVRLRRHRHPFHVRLASTDWLVLEEIFHRGEYSVVEREIQQARFIVDLGANAGFSVRYWNALYPQAQILAVEPHPGNCRVCEKNIKAAKIGDRIKLVQGGVGATRGRAELLEAGGEWGYQVSGNEMQNGIAVEIYPLETLLNDAIRDGIVDLLKCDIEGAERDLFAQCAAWIHRVSAIVVELHPPYGLAALKSDIARAGGQFRVVEVSKGKELPVVFLKNIQARKSRPLEDTARFASELRSVPENQV
ncbi:MAG TPA: FkbM family methyltransferase [Verrucomicrobiae bacterium]|nr:FkbM family methyltransferase [Verrucomicrobiae bacterium]